MGVHARQDPPTASAIEEFDARPSLTGRPALSGFAALIAPLSPEEFLAERYHEKRPTLFRGPRDRFAALVTWRALNRLLSTNSLRSPRLRMFRDGVPIPSPSYGAPDFGFGWRGRHKDLSGLDDHRFMTYLRQGGTMILNDVDKLLPPVAALADVLEAEVGGYGHANLYASWYRNRGFPIHWDSHDVFVVQVAGSKTWRVYGETRRFPLKRDTEENFEPPTEVRCSAQLNAGDLLYLPRGWWHDAGVESDEGEDGTGSIHLTYSVLPLTGPDLLHWLAGRLSHHELFRRDLPLRGATTAQADAHRRGLRELIDSALEGDFLGELEEFRRSAWSERPRLALGTYVEPWRSPAWDRCEIELRGAARAWLEEGEDGITFSLVANGYTRLFDRECIDLVRHLVETGNTTIGALKAFAPDRFDAAFVDEFARMLIEQGTVFASAPDG